MPFKIEIVPRMRKLLPECLFLVSPLLISVLLYQFLKHLPKTPYINIIGSMGSLILILSLLLKHGDKTVVAIRSALVGLLYLLWLQGTFFGFEGFYWDSRYVVHSVQRFYFSFLPYSHEYKYVHFSYPPLYYFLLGRIGALFQIALPSLLKYSSYLFVVYLPYLWGYGLRGIFKENRWYAAFILSLLIPFKTYFTWYEAISGFSQKCPHLIGTFLMIIWYIWVRKKNPSFWRAGLAGGVVFAFHYYPFFVISIAILIELGMILAQEDGFKEAFPRFVYFLKIGLMIMAVNLIWLVPVFVDLIKYAWGTSFTEWFIISSADVVNIFGVFEKFDFFSIVYMAAIINIFLNLSKPKEMDSLRLLFYAIIALLAIFYGLILFFKTPISLNNLSLLFGHILAFSFVFIIIHLGRTKSIPIIILLVLISTSVLNQFELNYEVYNHSVSSSRRYERSSDFRKTYDLQDEIIFPYTNELFYGKNTYSFISPIIMYSDVAGSYERRLGYLKNLVDLFKSNHVSEFHRKLKNTPFGQVNYLMLKRDKDRLFFDLKIYLNELKHPDKESRDIFFYFSPDRFRDDFFEKIYMDDEFVVYRLK